MKSTFKTSRKTHAMNTCFRMLTYFSALYAILLLCDKNPSEMIFVAFIGAITAVVSTLNIADGMKGHEHD
jgi:uncharacterized membrane protein YjjB (DUF3815 family)